MELSSRPEKDDAAEHTVHDNPGFMVTGTCGYMNGPNKVVQGVSFIFSVERANGRTQFEAFLTNEELIELVKASQK